MSVKMYIRDASGGVASEIVPPEESNSRVATGWVFSVDDLPEPKIKEPTTNLLPETDKLVVEENKGKTGISDIFTEMAGNKQVEETEELVQIKNPKTGKYTKIDRATGKILSHKKTAGPYVNVPIVET